VINVKRGDTVLVAHRRESETWEDRVASVGPKWITTEGGSKYNRETGYGEYGSRLYASRAAYDEALAARARLTQVCRVNWYAVSDDRIARVLAILAERPQP
jgi:hypothetical protein